MASNALQPLNTMPRWRAVLDDVSAIAGAEPSGGAGGADAAASGFARLDEGTFVACVQQWLACARTQKQSLAGKLDKEQAVQVVFNRLWSAQTINSDVEGVCRDGVRVTASIRATSAALNHAMLDHLSEQMQTMQLHNVGVFGTLFDELNAELAVRAAVAPLLGGVDLRPDERLGLLRDGKYALTCSCCICYSDVADGYEQRCLRLANFWISPEMKACQRRLLRPAIALHWRSLSVSTVLSCVRMWP